MPYYEFPENEYYALIYTESEEKAKEIYKRDIGGDEEMSIYPVVIHPMAAKKHYEDVVIGSEQYDEVHDAFEHITSNQVLLMDGLVAH